MVAEFEADLIRLRTREGMRVARGQGPFARQAAQAQPATGGARRPLYRAGEHSVSELEDLFGITRSTVYRAVQRDTRRQDAGATVRNASCERL